MVRYSAREFRSDDLSDVGVIKMGHTFLVSFGKWSLL